MQKQTIVTGIKPTGTPHLGNYLGMIKPTIELCERNANGDNYVFIANYHALDGVQDAKTMQELTYLVAATMLGCGLDPGKTCFFRESDVPEIAELSTLLMYVCPKGLMNRSHAYKAQTQVYTEGNERSANSFINKYGASYKIETTLSPYNTVKRLSALDEAGAVVDSVELEDADTDVRMGLYTYSILMAADVLAFDGTHVPVGRDQTQHIEIMRDLAGYFNNAFGPTLQVPEGSIQEDVATVPGLDGRKMSKSYGNVVPIFAPEKEILASVKRVVTDSKRPEEPKDPETNTVYQIFRTIADKAAVAEMARRFIAGEIGYGEAKQMLADRIVAEFSPKFERFQYYNNNRHEVDAIFVRNASIARAHAAATVARVRKAMGV